MKKLLSLLLATIMIFSCSTVAVNALYKETVTEKVYVDDLLETVKTTNHTDITYDSLGLKNLVGQDYIDAITKIDSTVTSGKEDLLYTDSIGRPIYDKFGNEIYKEYAFNEKTTVQNEILGINLDFLYNSRSALFTDSITAKPQLKAVLDLIKTYARNNKFAKALEALDELEEMLGIKGELKADAPEEKRTLKRNTDDIRAQLEIKESTTVNELVNTLRGLLDIDISNVTLLFGDANMFLLRILKSKFSDFRFYTQPRAIMCINFLGNLFYQNFTEISADTKLFNNNDYIYSKNGNDYIDENIFFKVVAEYSGFASLIQTNWVEYGDARANYRPLLLLLGVTEETLLPSEYYRGDRIATEILRCAFTKIMGEGPITYFANILNALSKAYLIEYYDATRLLFLQKLGSHIDYKGNIVDGNGGYEDDLKSLHGLLNLIFNNNDHNNLNKFQFAPLPETRLACATDKSEFYLNLLIYMNINAHYLNNQNVINNFIKNFVNKKISNKVEESEDGTPTYSDRQVLTNLINGICGENVEDVLIDPSIENLTMENLEGKPDEFLKNVGEAFARMIKKIADWLQMWIDIFTGKLEFGAGAFD